jgi:hypothetical protein
MRTLDATEVAFVAGGDMLGNAMIRLGGELIDAGQTSSSLPGGKSISPGLDRAGRQFVDAGQRRNDGTGGGPNGG